MAAKQVIDEINDYLETNQSEKSRLTENIEKDIERVNNDIRNAQYDLKRLPKDRETEFEEQLLKQKRQIDKIMNQLKKKSGQGIQEESEMQDFDQEVDQENQVGPKSSRRKKNQNSSRARKNNIQFQNDIDIERDEEANHRIEKIDYRQADVQVVGNAALNMQAESKKALERIQKNIGQIDELADQQLLELQRQNERIMKIDTQLNQIESTSQRAMKYIRYFGKNYMTDKFIIFMVILIAGALVGIIIAAVVKDKN
ncbi:qa-snare protein [Stylonychia lemnae]|uniref:Qa-snare protein n=1 Tax=Stylonychia lemnae TaxID=5949 RepID=A0A078A7R5_STYLE|nr:qa-snare protein [Stylonychia lemnae]|eukprot:CDW78289.1 qa-snare protein [Stylonychia lemnae]